MDKDKKNQLTAVFWSIILISPLIILWNIHPKIEINPFLLAYLSFLVALLIFFIVDLFKRPNFVITLGAINESEEGSYRFLHVNIINLDWPFWFFLFRKGNAVNTTAEIVFKEKDFNKTILSVQGRWSSNPEPIIRDSTNKYLLFDEDKARQGGLITISPSRHTKELREGKLGIAVKVANENLCYGFSDNSYNSPNFPGKDSWKLQRGIYDIDVIVRSGRFSKKENFVLENLGSSLQDFILRN